jgi:signal peptidase II
VEVVTEADDARIDTGRSWEAAKSRLFFGIIGPVVLLDVVTKFLVQQNMRLYQQTEVIGDYFRLTYIHNPGAAFGIHVGEHSRIIFLVLSVVALGALAAMYWSTPIADKVRLSAISLICAGAMGNLIDRVRSEQGVIDFIDVGIGDLRWPVFNVADIAVTTGAIFLALSLWQEDQTPREDRRSDPGG